MTGILNALIAGVSGAVKDTYFNLVSLLLPGNGTNGATNNSFVDSSTANSGTGWPITRNGDVTQGTFSPFSQTGWSGYFDGTNDNISVSSSTDLAVGSGAFTIEMWVFTADTVGMFCASQTVGGLGFGYNIDNSSQGLWLGRVGTGVDATSGVQLPYNQWNHIAVTRDGSNNVKFFVNGTQSGSTQTVTTNYGTSAQGLYVAADQNGSSNPYGGYISNLRYIKGQSILGTATSFTVPTSPLTSTAVGWAGTGVASSITGTVSLLTCQSNRFVDNSTTPKTLTPNNGVAITPFSPFAPTQSYLASAVGGSGYFDGSGDYLTLASNAALTLSGDLTAQFWVYLTTVSGSPTVWSSSAGGQTIQISAGNWVFYDGAATQTIGTSVANTWQHIAFSRTGTTLEIYLDGVRGVSYSYSTTLDFSGTSIGYRSISPAGNNITGYLSGFRLIKGTGIYTGTTMTVPTAPLTNITNTSLLLNFTNAGVVDATSKNDLETVGNAQISTAQSKWGGGSIYLDGTTNTAVKLLAGNQLSPFSGDYTYECWVYFNSFTGIPVIFDTRASNTAVPGLQLSCSTGGVLTLYGGASTATLLITGGTLSTGQWYYIALVRSGSGSNNTKLYLNGSQSGSSATDTTNYNNQGGYIGAGASGTSNYVNGYIDDFRFTRYARTITASPTAPFPVQ